MEHLGAWGTLINEKNLKSIISCQTPFKKIEAKQSEATSTYSRYKNDRSEANSSYSIQKKDQCESNSAYSWT